MCALPCCQSYYLSTPVRWASYPADRGILHDGQKKKSMDKRALVSRIKEEVVRRRFVLIMCVALPLTVFAKDKPTFQIEVVGTDAWQRDMAIHHAATAGTSNTNCNTNGSADATTYGNTTTGTVNATTNCTTTTAPGTPAYTTHQAIQQESVHAILNGQHVTLWCQAGFRKCANLAPGLYTAEADGDKAVKIYVYSLITHKLMGKMKYRLVGSW